MLTMSLAEKYDRTVSRDGEVALEINKSICSDILNKVSCNFRSPAMNATNNFRGAPMNIDLRTIHDTTIDAIEKLSV